MRGQSQKRSILDTVAIGLSNSAWLGLDQRVGHRGRVTIAVTKKRDTRSSERDGRARCSVTAPWGVEKGRSMSRIHEHEFAGQRVNREYGPIHPRLLRQITQIYEGTNQVQRIVMARQLLKGLA